ncbi:MAG: tetratricopeptide repeat protein [Nitrosopumilus sp.]|nr:tetratricopeptide repeat protein [Nitrosopumilus sp.]
MSKLFGKKNKEKKINSEIKESEKIVSKETSLVDPSYNIKKLYKKGVNLMADEKLDDAIEIFEQALRIEPDNVEILMKLGYARFHLEDHLDALKVYDKVLEIDVTNPEAWNLKGLVHYEQRKYAQALDAVNKAIDSDKSYGMAWYNKACFLSLLNQVPESLQALKHAIEIDVKNARKSIRDKDFANVRIEEGFKRIQEVVVLESVKQGYHTIGAIVWTTFLDKIDADVALKKLLEKGLIVQNEKRDGLSRIPIYDLADNIAEKIGKEKIGFFGLTKKKLPKPVKNLKAMSQAIHSVREAIEEADVEKTIEIFDEFIDTTKSGEQMIENFFEEHREIRLWKIRLKDRGEDYIIENKEKMLELLDNIEVTITKKLRDEIA